MSKSIPTKPFSTMTLGKWTRESPTPELIEKCKEYILQYFYPTLHGIFFYNVEEKQFEQIFNPSGRDATLPNYIPNGIKITYLEGKSKETWHGRKWLIDDVFERYKLVLKLGEPAIDYEKQTINLMGTMLHAGCKPFEEYSAECQAGVQAWCDHITNVWCSGRKEQAEFVLDWISCLGKKKVKCLLYLQSLEQSGKGIVIDFLQNHVFGKSLVKITSAMETLNTYTQPMEGKILVNINEMPCHTTGEYKAVMNNMKTLVTDATFECRKMYSQGRTQTNTFGLILFSNNDAITVSNTNYRRFKMLDVSNKYCGNTEYFDNLFEHMNDSVGEAFFAFLENRYHTRGKYINVDKFPRTETFKDKICERLNPVYDMLKHCFIKKGKSVEHTLKSLYSMYKDHHEKCRVHKGLKAACKSNVIFSKDLKDLKCMVGARKNVPNPKTGKTSKCLVFTASVYDLYHEFDSKGWIHELDDIEKPESKAKPKAKTPEIVVNEESSEESEMSPDGSEYEEVSDDVSSENEITQNLDQGLVNFNICKNTISFD